MAIDQYNHFVAIVAGDNPEALMSPFDRNIKTEPRVVYKYNDAEALKNQYVKVYEVILERTNKTLEPFAYEDTKDKLEIIKSQTPEEFYYDLTEEYEHDENTGDAITRENPNGKWLSYRLGKLFSIPFITNDGKEVFQAKKGDVNWELMHLHGQEPYIRAWEMVMDGSKPTTEFEEQIYKNMKNRTTYFEKYGTKDNYVLCSTAFWGYAFVSKNGWLGLDDDMDQFEWVKNYYERFIEPLPNNTLLTIYECTQ